MCAMTQSWVSWLIHTCECRMSPVNACISNMDQRIVMSHIWMSFVTCTNESCHICEWVTSHMTEPWHTWMRNDMSYKNYRLCVSIHTHVTHMNESCHTTHEKDSVTHVCVIYYLTESCNMCLTFMSRVTNESCHEWVVSRMSRVTNESRRVAWASQWIMSHMWMMHGTHDWFMAHMAEGVTNESCHEWVTSRCVSESVNHVTYVNDAWHTWLIHGTHGWVMAHMNESCHERFTSCRVSESVSHFTYVKEPRHIWLSHGTHEWVVSRTSHVVSCEQVSESLCECTPQTCPK